MSDAIPTKRPGPVRSGRVGLGAYGLIVTGDAGARWLSPAAADWQSWELVATVGDRPSDFAEVYEGDVVTLALAPAGFARMDRKRQRTELVVPRPTAAGFAHPYLASTAAVVARWSGMLSFHAGGFVVDGGVWGILGDREQGKTSAVMWLARHGFPAFCDDLLVVRGGEVLAGPRCIDLREEAARRFGVGEDVGVVGTRRRWRVAVPPVAPCLPLRGWIVLRWSDRIRTRRAEPAERLAALTENRGLRLAERSGLAWLEALARPMLVVERPKEWSTMDAAMTQLLDSLS